MGQLTPKQTRRASLGGAYDRFAKPSKPEVSRAEPMAKRAGDTETACLRFFAPCPRGLETVLGEELAALGAVMIRTVTSGVHFHGDRSCGYRVNLHSRIASRVLLWVASGRYRNDDDVYRIARRQDWSRRFRVEQDLRVDLSAQGSAARSIAFLTLRIKDGIVDAFRERCMERPSVDRRSPEVRVFGHLDARELHLYLDWSGEPLFKRGWRGQDDKGEAPLKENLAAGMLALSRWNPEDPLADLFCGSGTLLIEAAQQRFGIAPGSQRSFAFERLADFDPPLWQALREEALQRSSGLHAKAILLRPLLGMDIEDGAVRRAERNALRAGLPATAILWECGDAFLSRSPLLERGAIPPEDAAKPRGPSIPGADMPEPAVGLLISNPPYGERLERPENMRLGRGFRDRWPGWTLWVLSTEPELPALWHMRASRKIPLMNGALACRLFAFPLRARTPDPATGDGPPAKAFSNTRDPQALAPWPSKAGSGHATH